MTLKNSIDREIVVDRDMIFVSFIFFLIIIGTMNSLKSEVSFIGYLAIALVLLITNFFCFTNLIVSKKSYKLNIGIISFLLVFTTISFLSLLQNPSIDGIINIIQFFLCIGFTLYLANSKINKASNKVIITLVVLFISFHFTLWIINGVPSLFSSIYPNSNILGPYIFFLLFYLFFYFDTTSYKHLYIIYIFLGFLLILFSDARSVLISISIAALTFLIWKIVTKNIFIFTSYFVFILFQLLLFIFVYPFLPRWKYFPQVEAFFLKYTDKSLMSGRDEIWVPLINQINNQPLLGYGPGSTADSLLSINVSAHNLYLQILMQSGYLGLIVFFMMLTLIWYSFWKIRKEYKGRIIACFFIAILIHQSFEITLIQNQLSIGLLQWSIVAFGLNYLFRNNN